MKERKSVLSAVSEGKNSVQLTLGPIKSIFFPKFHFIFPKIPYFLCSSIDFIDYFYL